MSSDSKVKSDIAESKQNKGCNFSINDGKIICTYSLFKENKNKDMGGEWISFDKSFDSFKDFEDYSQSFFKPTIS